MQLVCHSHNRKWPSTLKRPSHGHSTVYARQWGRFHALMTLTFSNPSSESWEDPAVFPPPNACTGLLSCTVYFLTSNHTDTRRVNSMDSMRWRCSVGCARSILALRLCGLCSMFRYLHGMLQDCTVCLVPVVNKEPFYIKKNKYTEGHGATLMVVATNLYYHALRVYLLPYNVTATVSAIRMNRKN